MHFDKEAMILAGLFASGVREGAASGAAGIMPDLHLLAAAVSAGIFMAGLACKAGMIGMTYIERHPEGLSNAADGGVKLIADMFRILLAEPLDDPGLPGHVGEIAKWGKLDPMILTRLLGRELIGKEESYRDLLGFVGEVDHAGEEGTEGT
jgi:hypothetical protein